MAKLRRFAPLIAACAVIALAALAGCLTTPASLVDDAGGIPQAGAKPPHGARPCQWRVVWTENPATEATICWTTAVETKENVVEYSFDEAGFGFSAQAATVAAQTNGRHTGRTDLYFHWATLRDLKPDMGYAFTITSDGQTSPDLWFRTAPAEDKPVTFLYGGDSRSDRNGRRIMNLRLRTLVEQDPAILCLVHGGDYIYDGDDIDEWSQWLTDNELTTTSAGRVLPIVPARGNHEAGDVQLDEVFANPGGRGLNYFATRLTPQVLIVNLNTEIATGGDQAAFLERALAANTGIRWQMANYHGPAYPAVKQPSPAKQNWVPLFDKYNLDVAFESDGHTIKRTQPVRGDRPSADGVVYIGEGGLGVKPRTPKQRWYFENGGKIGSSSHVQKVTVTAESLKVETILYDGSVFDVWERKPRVRP